MAERSNISLHALSGSGKLAASLPAALLSVKAQAGPRSRSWAESTLAGLIVLLAFGWSAVAAGLEWQPIAAGRVARLAVPTEGNPGFTLLSGAQTRIHFTNALDDRLVMENNNFMEGSGVALGDFDGDGWCDLYFCAINGTNALYRNRGDWTFEDVTARAGVGGAGWHSTGAVFADVDGDGDLDLVVNTLGGGTHCFLNLGNGRFREVTEEAGLKSHTGSLGLALADIDGDGDLDLYVSNYLEFDVNNVPKDSPLCRYRGLKVQCGPRGLIPAAARFFENQGNGKFVDATAKSGIGNAPKYYGLGVVWGDYDNDGDLDIFVANDSTPNFLFRNNGNKTFTEVALKAGTALSEDGREQASMGVDLGDYDNDGDLDLIVTNFSEDYNTLYRNDGNGSFTDVTYSAGIGEIAWPYLGWGTQFVDFDLDGFLDLVVANGHVYPEVDKQELGTSYRQRNFLFKNLGNGKFADVGRLAGEGFKQVRCSRGLAVGDVNNDGRPDILISNLDEPPSLLLNRGTSGNWILLKLRGTKSNRSAIGARVTLRAGARTQIREVRSGGSYQSQSDLRVHFGLGPYKRIDEIRIRWPTGRLQVLKDVEANRILEVQEN